MRTFSYYSPFGKAHLPLGRWGIFSYPTTIIGERGTRKVRGKELLRNRKEKSLKEKSNAIENISKKKEECVVSRGTFLLV